MLIKGRNKPPTIPETPKHEDMNSTSPASWNNESYKPASSQYKQIEYKEQDNQIIQELMQTKKTNSN